MGLPSRDLREPDLLDATLGGLEPSLSTTDFLSSASDSLSTTEHLSSASLSLATTDLINKKIIIIYKYK